MSETTCRCGHDVEEHHMQDPGWCHVCESCKYQPRQRQAPPAVAIWPSATGANPLVYIPGREMQQYIDTEAGRVVSPIRERAARAIFEAGGWAGECCDHTAYEDCAECRRVCRSYAEAVLGALGQPVMPAKNEATR